MFPAAAETMDAFINNWNEHFPNYKMSVEDLRKPLSMIGALFQVFDRLGIDRDAVLLPPNEENLNENLMYYWDLVPVINITRVFNHLFLDTPEAPTIDINHLLQPMAQSSRSILMLLLNLLSFNEDRLRVIAPHEEDLFNVASTVKALEERKNELFEKLNQQAQERGKRAERIEQMQQEIQQLEEELKTEQEARDQEKTELEAIIKENDQKELILVQKRATKEGLIAEKERKKAMRVYDADDIRSQAAQASQSVQEAEEKLNALGDIIKQKENSLKILQMIKPNLDTANNLLDDISKLRDYDANDLDADSKDGELDVLNTEIMELKAVESDLSARRTETIKRRHEAQVKRQNEQMMAESALREAEDQDKKRRSFILQASQRTQELKELTLKYDEQKKRGFETIQKIREDFNISTKTWEEALVKMVEEARDDMENKMRMAEQ